MTIGSKFFASSFIVLSNGEKIYLSNTFSDLEEQMSSKKKEIEVTTSNLFSKTYIVRKKRIECYGRKWKWLYDLFLANIKKVSESDTFLLFNFKHHN